MWLVAFATAPKDRTRLQSTDRLEEYVGKGAPSWPSFSGRSMAKVTADMHLLIECHRPQCWHLGDRSDFAQLLDTWL